MNKAKPTQNSTGEPSKTGNARKQKAGNDNSPSSSDEAKVKHHAGAAVVGEPKISMRPTQADGSVAKSKPPSTSSKPFVYEMEVVQEAPFSTNPGGDSKGEVLEIVGTGILGGDLIRAESAEASVWLAENIDIRRGGRGEMTPEIMAEIRKEFLTLSRELQDLMLRLSATTTRTVKTAFRAGELLCRAKAATPHGKWELLVTNYFKFSLTTAKRCMMTYRRSTELKSATLADSTSMARFLLAPEPDGSAAVKSSKPASRGEQAKLPAPKPKVGKAQNGKLDGEEGASAKHGGAKAACASGKEAPSTPSLPEGARTLVVEGMLMSLVWYRKDFQGSLTEDSLHSLTTAIDAMQQLPGRPTFDSACGIWDCIQQMAPAVLEGDTLAAVLAFRIDLEPEA